MGWGVMAAEAQAARAGVELAEVGRWLQYTMVPGSGRFCAFRTAVGIRQTSRAGTIYSRLCQIRPFDPRSLRVPKLQLPLQDRFQSASLGGSAFSWQLSHSAPRAEQRFGRPGPLAISAAQQPTCSPAQQFRASEHDLLALISSYYVHLLAWIIRGRTRDGRERISSPERTPR